jgi:hypothetical protein
MDLNASYARIFIGVRLAQNMLVFILASLYWRRLGLGRLHALMGLAVLGWGMTYSGYGSHLAFDTYFDVIFYLIGGLLILNDRAVWIIPLSALAAFNRETGILIPSMLFVTANELRATFSMDRRKLIIGGIGLLLFLGTTVGIRAYFGGRPFMETYQPGWSLLLHNLKNRYTYFSGFATVTLFPFIALLGWKKWPSILRRLFLLMVPIWLIIHSFSSVMAEVRLFLVPYVLILLPAAILIIQNERLCKK